MRRTFFCCLLVVQFFPVIGLGSTDDCLTLLYAITRDQESMESSVWDRYTAARSELSSAQANLESVSGNVATLKNDLQQREQELSPLEKRFARHMDAETYREKTKELRKAQDEERRARSQVEAAQTEFLASASPLVGVFWKEVGDQAIQNVQAQGLFDVQEMELDLRPPPVRGWWRRGFEKVRSFVADDPRRAHDTKERKILVDQTSPVTETPSVQALFGLRLWELDRLQKRASRIVKDTKDSQFAMFPDMVLFRSSYYVVTGIHDAQATTLRMDIEKWRSRLVVFVEKLASTRTTHMDERTAGHLATSIAFLRKKLEELEILLNQLEALPSGTKGTSETFWNRVGGHLNDFDDFIRLPETVTP